MRGMEQERRSEPEVSFFFSAHGIPEDYEGIKQAFKETDVFVIESHGWKEEELQLLRSIAAGDKMPSHLAHGQAPRNINEFEEDLLFGSKKRIEIIDVPEGHPLQHEDDGTSAYFDVAERFIAQGNLEDTLASFAENAKRNAEYLRKKDAFLKERLNALLDNLSKEPGRPLKVLVQMGSTHSEISHALRRTKIAQRVKNEMRFNYGDELVRTFRFDKQPSEELLVHALFEKTVASLYHEALYKIPYLKRVDFFRNTLAPVDRQKALVMGELMENESFLLCIMAHEPDTRNTRASIFENAWKRVMGTDIASLIKDVAQQSDDR